MAGIPAFLMSLSRRLAQTRLPVFSRYGWSGQQALNKLKSLDIGYRRQDFYRDWNYWKGQEKTWSQMRKLDPTSIPGSQYYPTAGYKLPSRYATKFELLYRDKLTGQIHKTYRTVYHTHMEAGREVDDIGMTKSMEELKEAAAYSFEHGSPQANAELTAVIPREGWASAETEY